MPIVQPSILILTFLFVEKTDALAPLLAFACCHVLPPCFLRKKERGQRHARKQGGRQALVCTGTPPKAGIHSIPYVSEGHAGQGEAR